MSWKVGHAPGTNLADPSYTPVLGWLDDLYLNQLIDPATEATNRPAIGESAYGKIKPLWRGKKHKVVFPHH